jgi:hypothetical protein
MSSGARARPVAGHPEVREAGGVRRWLWLQLLIGWLPVWALYTMLIVSMHGGPFLSALLIAFRTVACAAALGLLVQRYTELLPWPRPVTVRFVVFHTVAAWVYAAAWVGLTSLIESLFRGGRFLIIAPAGITSFLILGVWLYVMVAGVSYATRATERAARAEATAARSQLAALREQLNPHFLFNTLHTVVQLIPVDPRRAAQAAERLAGMLRTTIEEDRDVVTLREERAFVERYLDIERIRFGDRLLVDFDVTDAAAEALMPSFALQTLVENAVRHGAAPRVEPTRIGISGVIERSRLILTVEDDGAGVDTARIDEADGTGLRRLRDRLDVLYGPEAELSLTSSIGRGFKARVAIPMESRK